MLHNLPLISVLILILFGIAMLVIRIVIPRFLYSWLIAASGALIVWPLILVSRNYIPSTIPLKLWDIPGLISTPPALLLDPISWPFAFSVVTLLLATILTDVVRVPEADWSSWTADLFLGAFGLFAVLADNPLTLMLAWAGLDLIGLLIPFSRMRTTSGLKKGIAVFSIKVTGILLLLWAMILAQNAGVSLTFTNIPPQVCIFLLLAAWIHLGVFPISDPAREEYPDYDKNESLTRLLVIASSFMLFGRVAISGILDWQLPYFYLLITFLALFGSLCWLISRNVFDGEQFWILSLSAVSMLAAARGSGPASTAWGLAALLTGGLLFLFSARLRYLLIFPAIGLIGISGLPLTLSWNGGDLYTSPISPLLFFILISQALLMLGYYRLAMQRGQPPIESERWIWIVYTWGLLLLALSQFIITWSVNFSQGELIRPIKLGTILPSLLIAGLIFIGIVLDRRGWRITVRGEAILRSIFSFQWVFRVFEAFYHVLDRGLAFLSVVLEGEGGVLWALLWLVLLLTFLTQSIFGGI